MPNQSEAVTPTFEDRSDKVVVIAGFWREMIVEKSRATDDHQNHSRVPREPVSMYWKGQQ